MINANPTCVSESSSTYRWINKLGNCSGFPSSRINLSPFTKDFRGGKQSNESVNQFFVALPYGGAIMRSEISFLIETRDSHA